MPSNLSRATVAQAICFLLVATGGLFAQETPSAAAPLPGEAATVDYARDVKPILQQFCIRCHGPETQRANLRLDAAPLILQGGDSGPVLVAGDESSLLLRAVLAADDVAAMPPEDEPQLDDRQKELLRAWIIQGAAVPADEQPQAASRRRSDHWSLQLIVRPSLPAIANRAWPVNPIDYFVAAQQEAQGLTPSAEADRHTLIRRVQLDLTGLLPSPEEADAFAADPRPDAYERLVQRLLASPHHGERWGRHWLDLARYADSNGYTRDMPREIWKYREWVVGALNRNMPFNQFVIEQLAGDLLPDATTQQLVATGFHRNTLFNEEGGTDPEQFRIERTVDRVNTTGAVLLGLTIGCAQCHDHKYDPITQREYYQLLAFFNNAEEPTIDVPSAAQVAAGEPTRRQQLLDRIGELEAKFRAESWEVFEAGEMEWEQQLTEDEKKNLPFQVLNAVNLSRSDRNETHNRALYDYYQSLPAVRQQFPVLEEVYQLRQALPVFASTMIMRERAEPRETFVHIRGDFLRHGTAVIPQVPEVLPPLESRGARADRLDLAQWLVSDKQPLTPRVVVNRMWQRYFGRGLVETENDFGTQGTRPSHPELLDWLAAELVASGWDMKHLHTLIVTSATYRQASLHRADVVAQDPQNVWLARQNRLRVEAEILRDAALSASGMLTYVVGGPSVYPPQPEGVFDFTQDRKPWPTATNGDRYRRAMYTYLWRSSPHPALSVFDFPDANVTCTRRLRSNTPLQSLNLANDETYMEFARGLAQRAIASASDDTERVRTIFRRCLVRQPTEGELNRLRTFVAEQRNAFATDLAAACSVAGLPPETTDNAAERASWVSLARVLFNVDEFVTRE